VPRPRRLRVLRLLLGVGETSAPYNQFSLAARHRHDIAICAFFRPAVPIPPDIAVFAGDNTFRGFLRALDTALDGRPYDVIHVHKPHVGLLFLLKALVDGKRAHLPPIVFTVHNSFQNFSLRNKALLLPMFAFADRVVCCGREARQSFPRPFRWLAGRRLDCIPNGVDLGRVDRYRRRLEPLPPKQEAFTILSVGRLIPVKSPETLLAAFERSALATAKLLFIGDGGLKRELHERITRAGLEDRVRLTGLIPRESVYDHCLRAHLFVSASRGEGLPIAVLEAMACQLPVILSDIPPHREVVEGGGGLIPLIPLDDVDGFARAIARVAAMPEAERAELGRRGRALVEARFTLEAMLRNYEDVYRDAVSARGQPLAT
jgi:glycosyltransferase involved in cell wall biosynthesis